MEADPEQLFRVLFNLCRNSVEVLKADLDTGLTIIRRIVVSAERTGGVVEIRVSDTARECPKWRAKSFSSLSRAQHGQAAPDWGWQLPASSSRPMAVTIALADTAVHGTTFRIQLPDRPVPIDKFRARG